MRQQTEETPSVTWWKHEINKENLNKRMVVWDKKLHNLDDEMLYYVFNKASHIIEYRMERDSV